MTKKEKIKIVQRYFGSVMKDAEKYVEEQKDEKAYEYMKLFLKTQSVKGFCED